MALLNTDTSSIAHLSATLDIFSRCLSNCNCQKVIWNHSEEQSPFSMTERRTSVASSSVALRLLNRVTLRSWTCRADLLLQLFFCGQFCFWGRNMRWTVRTDVILQPVDRLRQKKCQCNTNIWSRRAGTLQCPHCTFLVLWGFFILEDFLMSTSVVFTHPGYENKTRMLISVEFVTLGHFGLWNSSTWQEMHLQMYVKSSSQPCDGVPAAA